MGVLPRTHPHPHVHVRTHTNTHAHIHTKSPTCPPPNQHKRDRPQLLGAELKNAGVAVFGNPSKKESLILSLPDIQQVWGGLAVRPVEQVARA